MDNILVVTTFHEPGLVSYGQRMLDTFSKQVDKRIKLVCYAENCNPVNPDPEQIKIINQKHLQHLLKFKETWKDIPKANGKCPWPERRPRDWHKEFKWDAVRFANKVYAVFDAYYQNKEDLIVWMDADTVCHSPISYEKFESFFKPRTWISYLGRAHKWPECGFYGIRKSVPGGNEFIAEFKRVYDDADNGIFRMEEWHDSFVFNEVLKGMRHQYPDINDLSGHLVKGEGHPMINTELGAYFDHLKGDRKDQGISKRKDLFKLRDEDYWKDVK